MEYAKGEYRGLSFANPYLVRYKKQKKWEEEREWNHITLGRLCMQKCSVSGETPGAHGGREKPFLKGNGKDGSDGTAVRPQGVGKKVRKRAGINFYTTGNLSLEYRDQK